MRLVVATVLGCLALAAPASARYLHMSDARPAAQLEADFFTGQETGSGDNVGSCWRAGPRVVQCGFTEYSGYSINPGNVAVIALRGGRLYGHTLIVGANGHVTNSVYGPRFISTLTS